MMCSPLCRMRIALAMDRCIHRDISSGNIILVKWMMLAKHWLKNFDDTMPFKPGIMRGGTGKRANSRCQSAELQEWINTVSDFFPPPAHDDSSLSGGERGGKSGWSGAGVWLGCVDRGDYQMKHGRLHLSFKLQVSGVNSASVQVG